MDELYEQLDVPRHDGDDVDDVGGACEEADEARAGGAGGDLVRVRVRVGVRVGARVRVRVRLRVRVRVGAQAATLSMNSIVKRMMQNISTLSKGMGALGCTGSHRLSGA